MSSPAKSFAEIFSSGSWAGREKFTDGTLQTDDGSSFKIHRIVLTQRSEYFYASFSFNLDQETVLIPNIDGKILGSILVYIYTGEIALDEKNVCDIIIASDYLLLDDLLKICGSYVIQNMTSTNCLPFLSIVGQIERLAIAMDCYRYALVHFEDILKAPNSGWKELPFEILIKMLDSASLNVTSERSVWEAIILWTEANSPTRLPLVPSLLVCLKLDGEGDENLAEEILSHSIVSRNPQFQGLMLSSQLNFHTLKNMILIHFASLDPLIQNFQYSLGPRMPNRLHVMARHIMSTTQWRTHLFLSYDNEFDFWRHIHVPYSFAGRMAVFGQRIYTFEEHGIGDIFDVLEEEGIEDEDQFLMTMPSEHGFIINSGEKSYHIDESDVSRYEIRRNRWEKIATAQDIIIQDAVPLNNMIFILGYHELEEVNIFQAFDTERNTWILVPAPNMTENGFFFVVHQEQVFAIESDSSHISPLKVEVYNSLHNGWASLPDLPFKYRVPYAVVADGKIVVYENNGEDTRRFQDLDPPVYWDESAHTWRIIDESSPWYHIERYSFLVLDDCRLVRDLTAKNRRPGMKWERILSVEAAITSDLI